MCRVVSLNAHVYSTRSSCVSSKVYALSHPFGDLLWSSPALEGTCEGTPYYTTSGDYVFVTHNNGSVGHFSVLDTNAGASVFFSYNQTNPFAPFGFFRQPSPGGNYGAGSGNVNDIAVWGYKPSPGATTGEDGSTFAFQIPPPFSLASPSVTMLLNNTSWRHTAPPLLAAAGQQMYFLVSRSKVRAWINARFSTSSDGEADFGRGSPTFKAAPYTPVVDNIDSPTVMCGGPADAEFACVSIVNTTNNTMATLWTATGGLVYGNPLMSTEGNRVYWADVAGAVSAYDPFTGTPAWTSPTGVAVEANPELSSDGARLFFADTAGAIVAWEIAEGTLPPVSLPANDATSAPTGLAATTAMPSMGGSPVSAPALSAESVVPTGLVDTTMPSAEVGSTPAPILTASPVTPLFPTSGVSSVAFSLVVVVASIVVGTILL